MVRKIHNVFLIGPMGAGKSSIGRSLARMLKLEFFDTDQEIEERTGASIDWIFDIEGEDGFRVREKSVIEELTKRNNIVLATGGGAIMTQENRQNLSARGTVVYLKTSLEQQYERTRKGTSRPLLRTDDVKQRIIDLNEERDPFYDEISDYAFPTDGLTVNAVATEIIKALEQD